MDKLKSSTIAIIIPDFDFGGEEKRAVFFANNYAKSFKKAYLLAPSGLSNDLLDAAVEHVELNVRKLSNIPSVIKLLKEKNIDFLQGHKRATLPYLLAAEKFTDCKAIFNFDNIYLKYNKLCSFISPRNIVYLSDVLKDFYAKFYKSANNTTINMGGDFYEQQSDEQRLALKKKLEVDGKFVILSLGRLSHQKNHILLLKALSNIKQENYICLIAGMGPLESELKAFTEEHGLTEKVRFIGHRDDVSDLLNLSDVLVQSSIFEGFPNVFIEAASVGLPIVATNVGSSSTLIGKNGCLVESNNAEELTVAILKVINNWQAYRREANLLSKNEFFLNFSKYNMFKNYELYLNNLK